MPALTRRRYPERPDCWHVWWRRWADRLCLRDVADIFSTIQGHVIGMMGGGAAEIAILGDSPPRFIEGDVYSANAIAGIVCRTDASRAAFIEHCYQEALAIIEENKPVVLALTQALIDHPERTLNSEEIDAVIAKTLELEARAATQARRAAWGRTVEMPPASPRR